ncbi:MAG: T9SS type A sorting domain-containing protein [bacterium]
MKKQLCLLLYVIAIALVFLAPLDLSAQTIKTVGAAGADYSTLKLAFDAINAGSITGAIILQIIDNTSETTTATLNASGGSASYSSVTIYPTSEGLTISGTIANNPLINLDGADNVTLDGRVNQLGSKSLTITNLSTSSNSNTSTVRYINDASNNIIKYCVIKGASTSAFGGVIYFYTAITTGNDDNTIDNCDITRSLANRPVNCILSYGSSSKTNSGNIISNNNIFNFSNSALDSYGIQISNNNTGWTISGNSFYESSQITPSQDVNYYAIYVAGGDGYTVSDNYIGGSDALCGGTAWTKANTKTNSFTAIYFFSGTGAESNIQGNTINNFSYSNSGAASWNGIYVSSLGTVNLGTTSGNTIGSSTGTGSITFTNGAAGSYFCGVYCDETSFANIRGNTIGAITVANSNSTVNNDFYGIYKNASSGTTFIINNLIGSLTQANSVNASSTSTSSNQYVYGIYCIGTDGASISYNTIANVRNGTTGGHGSIKGIITWSGANTITNNTVRDLTIANANGANDYTASVTGIVQLNTSSNQNVSENTIYNLSNTYASFDGCVIGLYYRGNTSGASTVSKNFIHSLSLSSTIVSAELDGIKIGSGATTYSNNIICLGSEISLYYKIYAIYETDMSSNNNLYFNSIYIGGSTTGDVFGTTGQSIALYSATNSTNRDFRNNIFCNVRSGGSIGKHYAISIAGTSNLTIDYNDYYAPSGVLGNLGGDKATLADWKTATGQDANSKSKTVTFVSTTDLHLDGTSIGDIDLLGTPISGITTDFDGDSRHVSYPYIGADESITTPLPVELVSFSLSVEGNNVTLSWQTATEVNNYGFEIERTSSTSTPDPFEWEKIGFVEGYGNSNSTKHYSFIDEYYPSGKVKYRLKQIDTYGGYIYSEEVSVDFGNIIKFELSQNFPNPFNPITTIKYEIPVISSVTLKMYDMLGREIITLINEKKLPGKYKVNLDGSNFPSGVYLYRLTAGNFVCTKKLILLK